MRTAHYVRLYTTYSDNTSYIYVANVVSLYRKTFFYIKKQQVFISLS